MSKLRYQSWFFYAATGLLLAFALYLSAYGYHLGGKWIILGVMSLLGLIAWMIAVFWRIYQKYTIAALMIAIITAPVLVLAIIGIILLIIQNK